MCSGSSPVVQRTLCSAWSSVASARRAIVEWMRSWKRHVAYSKAGRCPATHPVRLPTITLVLLYPPVRGGLLSAGRWATHADFINGWNQEALERLTAGLNADRR